MCDFQMRQLTLSLCLDFTKLANLQESTQIQETETVNHYSDITDLSDSSIDMLRYLIYMKEFFVINHLCGDNFHLHVTLLANKKRIYRHGILWIFH